jgi:large subunit ribosomal protein L6
MSRVGKSPITIPAGVQVEVVKGGDFDNQVVKVSGPNGQMERAIRRGITVEITDGVVNVLRDNEAKQTRSYHGLFRSLINNMVIGVATPYTRELEIVGIGYRAEQVGEVVSFALGYSHKINYQPPAGITLTVNNQTEVIVSGIDKQLVGEVAAKIRSFRKPEPYKGKGVRYKGEQVRRKSVKKAS